MVAGLGRHVLTELGVGSDAEDVYQFLLGSPRSTASEIAHESGLSGRRVGAALDELVGKSIVSPHDTSDPRRYQPAPPDLMVETLISAKEDALRRTRLEALQLGGLQTFGAEHTQAGDLVEVLSSRQASALRWNQLQHTARSTLDGFVRPPFTESVEGDEIVQEGLLGRNVVTRAVYDEAALSHPGILEHAARMAALGEQARVVSELPIKLVIADRSLAIMPFGRSDPDSSIEAALLVHPSTLLDALAALFDLYWELGTDLRLGDTDRSANGSEAADEDTVLTLMAAGYKDDSIASQLGVSTATVRRRIGAVQSRLKVTTRFQAGLALGRKNWRQRSAGADPDRLATIGSQPPPERSA